MARHCDSCAIRNLALKFSKLVASNAMPDKKQTTRIHSRIEITDPALVKKLETARNRIKPKPGWKPFLEMLIEQGLQNHKEVTQ